MPILRIFAPVKMGKVVILILLILKASVGMGMISLSAAESCCSATIEVVDGTMDLDGDREPGEDNGCCDGPDCQCYCCHALFLKGYSSEWSLHQSQAITGVNSAYVHKYKLLLRDAIWQPPRLD